MGYYKQERQGTLMGEPTKINRTKGKETKPITFDKKFKASSPSSMATGMPDQTADFPKNGRGPDWKMLRESTPGKGSI